jgi:hypothetical protein
MPYSTGWNPAYSGGWTLSGTNNNVATSAVTSSGNSGLYQVVQGIDIIPMPGFLYCEIEAQNAALYSGLEVGVGVLGNISAAPKTQYYPSYFTLSFTSEVSYGGWYQNIQSGSPPPNTWANPQYIGIMIDTVSGNVSFTLDGSTLVGGQMWPIPNMGQGNPLPFYLTGITYQAPGESLSARVLTINGGNAAAFQFSVPPAYTALDSALTGTSWIAPT